MHVNDLMIEPVDPVAADADLRRAAALMIERGLPVLAVGRGEDIVGTVGRSELVLACAEGRPPEETRVSEVMRARLVSCPVDADRRAALALMTEQDVDALLVRSAAGAVIGLLTRLRVLEGLAYPDDRPHGPTPEQVRRVRGQPLLE
jgi:predicted transcriptional regulator